MWAEAPAIKRWSIYRKRHPVYREKRLARSERRAGAHEDGDALVAGHCHWGQTCSSGFNPKAIDEALAS